MCVFASPVPDQVPFQHHPLLADVVQVALDVVDLLRAGLLKVVNHTLIHFPVVPSNTGHYRREFCLDIGYKTDLTRHIY